MMELYILLESSIDTQFQAWVSVTFAMIVASYASRNNLARRLRLLVAGLYVIVCVALLSRWVADIFRLYDLGMALYERAIDFAPLGALNPIARLTTFFLGTSGALYFLFFFENHFGDEENDGGVTARDT